MRKDLTDLRCLTARHIKLYFKDKQTFFMSLITPLILVVLFATFLRSVYVSSLTSALPDIELPDKLVNGFVAGWLISSILGVSSVTLAFCSQTVMVSDKAKKRIDDFLVAPVKSSVLSWSYFLATIFSTLLVCLVCLAIGLVYIAASGWYLTAADVLLILGNLVLCTAVRSLARGDRGDVFENGGRRRSRRHHRFLHVRVSLRRVYAYFPVCHRYPQFRDVYSRNLRDGIVPPLFHGRSGGGNSKIRAGGSGFRASRRVRFQFVFLRELRLSRRLCRRARRLGHPARRGVLPDRAFFRETEKARKAQYSALSMTPPPRHSSPRYKTAY